MADLMCRYDGFLGVEKHSRYDVFSESVTQQAGGLDASKKEKKREKKKLMFRKKFKSPETSSHTCIICSSNHQ